MKSKIDWRIFFILLGLCLISVVAVFPYVLTIQGEILKQSGISFLMILVFQLFQSAIIFSIAIFIGLSLSKKIGFYLPLLDSFIKHNDWKKIMKDIYFLSIIWGIITAITIYLTDYIFTLQGSAISTSQNYAPIWQKLLASFYGGITEEVVMRLFLMTLLTWFIMKVTKQSQPNQITILISVLLSAIFFGLGHLPITASLTTLTSLIVVRAVILNGIGGIVFGMLYWKKGLESAMIAHFTADIFLLTILPLILV